MRFNTDQLHAPAKLPHLPIGSAVMFIRSEMWEAHNFDTVPGLNQISSNWDGYRVASILGKGNVPHRPVHIADMMFGIVGYRGTGNTTVTVLKSRYDSHVPRHKAAFSMVTEMVPFDEMHDCGCDCAL